MARIRSIKPDFWTNGKVLECSPITRLMFIGMWNFADDKGRLPFFPKTIKAQIFAGDDLSPDDIVRMVEELSSNDLISVYFVDSKGYIEIKGWHHQKIDRPQPPKCPEPSEINRRIVAPDLRGSERIGEDKKKDGADAPIVNLFPKNTDPPSEEKSYFDRFKEICGPRSGGMAVKLKNHMLGHGKAISDARAAVETAASKSSPAEYIGAILKNTPNRSSNVYGDDFG